MPRQCLICSSDKRDEIDSQIAKGEGITSLAKRFDLAPARLKRHRKLHLGKGLLRTQTREQAGTLLEKIQLLELDAKRLGETAETNGDAKTALMAIKEIRQILELVGKLTGELSNVHTQVSLNFQMGPLPGLDEIRTRLSRLDTPAAAARRKWIKDGGPMPPDVLAQAQTQLGLPEGPIDAEFIEVKPVL